ncbi:DUF6790 family protein [Streptomyces sp. SYSU K217416]
MTQKNTSWARWLPSCVHFVGLACFLVAEAVQLAGHGYSHRSLLLNFITYLIGVNGIVTGTGHLLLANTVADSIGWPARTPWQWEVGCANFCFGVPGVMAGGQERGFWLAVIIASSVFLLGAAVGHVRELIASRNISPGNAGFILYSDIAIPVTAIALYLSY